MTGDALSTLGLGGVLITLGYPAGRKTLFAQPPSAIAAAWRVIVGLIASGSIRPIVERVYPLNEAGEALRHLIEDRPLGKVVVALKST